MNHAAFPSPLKLYTAASCIIYLYIYTLDGVAERNWDTFRFCREGLLWILFSLENSRRGRLRFFTCAKLQEASAGSLYTAEPKWQKKMTLFVSATQQGSLKKHLACHSSACRSVSMEAADEEVLLVHASDKPCVTRVTLKIPRLLKTCTCGLILFRLHWSGFISLSRLCGVEAN